MIGPFQLQVDFCVKVACPVHALSLHLLRQIEMLWILYIVARFKKYCKRRYVQLFN